MLDFQKLSKKRFKMRTKTLMTALVTVAVIFISGCTSATPTPAQTTIERIQEKGVLVLGTSGSMTPMTRSVNGGKDVVGFDVDVAQLMADSMNVKLVKRVIPFDQLLDALEKGEVDVVISNMSMTPERNLKVAFVGPYLTSGKCVITKQQDLATLENAKSVNNAANKLVVLKGSTSEAFAATLMPDVERVVVETQKEGVRMVKDDEVAGMLTEFPICASVVKSNPNAGFVSVFSKLTFEPIGIAVNANDTHMINWTQNFLMRADKAGALHILAQKWMGR